MFKLYSYQDCPYCDKVRAAFAEMNLDYEEVDAERGTPGSLKLLELGGKQQVPFLVDEEQGIFMYESDDIISYARARSQKN
ncbi:MAG: glutathione S-transferase N-terminal domain-containing protein [Patescibacteria group bacterium]